MQKDDRITEDVNKVDSDMQPIITTSASIEANPMLAAAFSTGIAHLYIGCDVKTVNGIGKLIGVVRDEAFVDYRGYENKGYVDEFGTEYDFVLLENEYLVKDIKPILRPFCDFELFEDVTDEMSEHEIDWLKSHLEIRLTPGYGSIVNWTAVYKMIQNKIDVFNLITSGHALNLNEVSLK